MGKLRYIEGAKYQVAEDYHVDTPILGERIVDDLFQLTPDGHLVIRKGFAWDGASGPTLDSKSSMSASLVHDVFCICMRGGKLLKGSALRINGNIGAVFRRPQVEDGSDHWRQV